MSFATRTRWDVDGLARIAAAIDTPIMADEAVFSPADAMRVARERAADKVSPRSLIAPSSAAVCEVRMVA